MSGKRDSTKARRICVDTHSYINPAGRKCMDCHVCKGVIDLVATKAVGWRADHIRRHAEGGEESAENLWPICLGCDTGPDGKAANDSREVAKGKAVAEKHYGIRKPKRQFPRRVDPWGYRND